MLTLIRFVILISLLVGLAILPCPLTPAQETAVGPLNATADSQQAGRASADSTPVPMSDQRQRIHWLAEAQTARLDGNRKRAVECARNALALDIKIFGATDDRVAWRYRELALDTLHLDAIEQALAYARQAETTVQRVHPRTSWQADQTLRFREMIEALATLPRSQLRRFVQAERKAELARETRDWQGMFEAHQFRLGVLTELLGERHLMVVAELILSQGALVETSLTNVAATQLSRSEQLLPQISVVPSPTSTALVISKARLAELTGKDELAERLYHRALVELQTIGAVYDTQFSTVRNNFAVLLEDQGRYEEAIRQYELACELLSEEAPETPDANRLVQENLMRLLMNRGEQAIVDQNLEIAQQLYQRASTLGESRLGGDHYLIAEARVRLQLMQRLRTLEPEQCKRYADAVRVGEKVNAALDAGDLDQALAGMKQRLTTFESLLGRSALPTAQARQQLAQWDLEGDAQQLELEAVAGLYAASLGKHHPEYASVLYDLAVSAEPVDSLAIERAEQAAAIYEEAHGKNDWSYVITLGMLGRLQVLSGDNRAASVLLDAKQQLEELGQTECREYIDVLSDLASVEFGRDRPSAALPLAKQAVDIARTLPSYDPVALSTLINELANAHYSLGHQEESSELYVESLGLLEEMADRPLWDYCMLLRNTGSVFA